MWRVIGKMSVPHCFDSLIGAKPKHPWVGLLSQAPHPVDEVAPPSQIPGLNLTQLNEIGTFRPNPHQFLDRWSTRACRARALQNWVVCHKIQIPKHRPSSLKHRHKLSNVIPFIPTPINRCENMLACARLNWTALLTPYMTLITDQSTSTRGVNINLHSSSLITKGVKSLSTIWTNPLHVSLHLSWWRPLVWGWN